MATFATNNADIARYARRPNDALWTQLIGMPLAFGVVAFFGIFVTSASKPLFGKVRHLVIETSAWRTCVRHAPGKI